MMKKRAGTIRSGTLVKYVLIYDGACTWFRPA